jgi:hypothetical protein
LELVLDIQQAGGENAILATELVRPEEGKRGGRSSRGATGDLRVLSHGE